MSGWAQDDAERKEDVAMRDEDASDPAAELGGALLGLDIHRMVLEEHDAELAALRDRVGKLEREIVRRTSLSTYDALAAEVARQGEVLLMLAEGNPSEARAALRGDSPDAPAPDAGREWAVDALDFTTFGRDEAGNMARGPLPGDRLRIVNSAGEVLAGQRADGSFFGSWSAGRADAPMPPCPVCGNNRQVWRNQISGRLRCHRVGCEADLPAEPAPAADAPLPYAVAIALGVMRGEGWYDTADGLEAWAREERVVILNTAALLDDLGHHGTADRLRALVKAP